MYITEREVASYVLKMHSLNFAALILYWKREYKNFTGLRNDYVYKARWAIPALQRSPAGLGTARTLPLCHRTSTRIDEQWNFCPTRRLGPFDPSLQTVPATVSTADTS